MSNLKRHPFRGQMMTTKEIAAVLDCPVAFIQWRMREGIPLDAPVRQQSKTAKKLHAREIDRFYLHVAMLRAGFDPEAIRDGRKLTLEDTEEAA